MFKYFVSPAERFAKKIHTAYGISLNGLYVDYILPASQTPESLEKWVVTKKDNSSSFHTQNLAKGWLGYNRYTVQAHIFETLPRETVRQTHAELKAKAQELITLNPQLQQFDPERLRTRQLYNLIWGIACKFTPRDIQNWLDNTIEHLHRDVEGLAAAAAREQVQFGLKIKIHGMCGIAVEWQPATETLQGVIDTFERESAKLKPRLKAAVLRTVASLSL